MLLYKDSVHSVPYTHEAMTTLRSRFRFHINRGPGFTVTGMITLYAYLEAGTDVVCA